MRFFRLLFVWAFVALGAGMGVAQTNSLGVRVGYNSRNESPVAGLWYQHSFSRHFRLAPNVDYYFRHNSTDALSLNCNVHFPWEVGQSGRVSVYPFAGVNYVSWNNHFDSTVDSESNGSSDDVTTRVNRFGFNIGGGVEYRVTPTMKVSLEVKGAFVKNYSSATATVSIGYMF